MVNFTERQKARNQGTRRGPKPRLSLSKAMEKEEQRLLPTSGHKSVNKRLLDKESARMWNRLRKECSWLTPADRDACERCANAWGMAVASEVRLHELIVRGDDEDLNAAAKVKMIYQTAHSIWTHFAEELGLTPTGRARWMKEMEKEGEVEESDEIAFD